MPFIDPTSGSTLRRLLSKAISHEGVADEAVGIWLFGSSLTLDDPNDIDLLYVYKAAPGASDRAIGVRRAIAAEISSYFGLSTDVVLLTEAEERDTTFIQTEQALLVWSPDPTTQL